MQGFLTALLAAETPEPSPLDDLGKNAIFVIENSPQGWRDILVLIGGLLVFLWIVISVIAKISKSADRSGD